METIEGQVERVTFFNEQNGFAVLRVKVRGQRELVTVLGALPAVNGGEWVQAGGDWVRDPQHGLQFRADTLRASAPNSREGIEKYLGSGMIKGIGPVLAKKLVAKFGDGVFDIIDHHSARLEEVDKVGPERRRRIKAAWAEQKVVREIMVFLHAHGASTSRAVRIYKTYGSRPSKTCGPILTSSRVTSTASVSKPRMPSRGNSAWRRIRSNVPPPGCATPFSRLPTKGTAVCPKKSSCSTPHELLEVDVSGRHRRRWQNHSPKLNWNATTWATEHSSICPGLIGAEKGIARRILHLAEQPPPYPEIDLARAIEWYEAKSGRTLSPSQREALAQALAARVFIITGGPGCWENTLLDALLAIVRAKQVRCLLCAPTGRAAQTARRSHGPGRENHPPPAGVRPGRRFPAQRAAAARRRPARRRRMLDGGRAAHALPPPRGAARARGCCWSGTWINYPRSDPGWCCATSSRAVPCLSRV